MAAKRLLFRCAVQQGREERPLLIARHTHIINIVRHTCNPTFILVSIQCAVVRHDAMCRRPPAVSMWPSCALDAMCRRPPAVYSSDAQSGGVVCILRINDTRPIPYFGQQTKHNKCMACDHMCNTANAYMLRLLWHEY